MTPIRSPVASRAPPPPVPSPAGPAHGRALRDELGRLWLPRPDGLGHYLAGVAVDDTVIGTSRPRGPDDDPPPLRPGSLAGSAEAPPPPPPVPPPPVPPPPALSRAPPPSKARPSTAAASAAVSVPSQAAVNAFRAHEDAVEEAFLAAEAAERAETPKGRKAPEEILVGDEVGKADEAADEKHKGKADEVGERKADEAAEGKADETAEGKTSWATKRPPMPGVLRQPVPKRRIGISRGGIRMTPEHLEHFQKVAARRQKGDTAPRGSIALQALV